MNVIGSLHFQQEPESYLDYLRVTEYTTSAEFEDLSGVPEKVGSEEIVYAYNTLSEPADNKTTSIHRQYFYIEPTDIGGTEFTPSEHTYPVSVIDPHVLYTDHIIQTKPPVTQVRISKYTFQIHVSHIPKSILVDSSYPQSFQFTDAVNTGETIKFYDQEQALLCEIKNTSVIPTISKLKLAQFADSFTVSDELQSYLVSINI